LGHRETEHIPESALSKYYGEGQQSRHLAILSQDDGEPQADAKFLLLLDDPSGVDVNADVSGGLRV